MNQARGRDRRPAEMKLWSLWLSPDPATPEYKDLATEIGNLAKKEGENRKKETRVFKPHVTLLGNIPWPKAPVAECKKVAARCSPFEIQLISPAECGETAWMALYLPAAGRRIAAARNIAETIFPPDKSKPRPEFQPHLSLLYTNDKVLAHGLKAQVPRSLGVTFTVNTLHLWSTPTDHGPDSVSEWKEEGSFPFSATA